MPKPNIPCSIWIEEAPQSRIGAVLLRERLHHHSFEEQIETIRAGKALGLKLCTGGILGMGETPEQRVELAEVIRDLDVDCVPVNFLNPRPGTPLADRPLVPAREALRWIALFRLGLPGVILRYAGGREVTLGELQEVGMRAGVNALIIGNYLTTLGRAPEEDLAMLARLSMPIGALSRAI